MHGRLVSSLLSPEVITWPTLLWATRNWGHDLGKSTWMKQPSGSLVQLNWAKKNMCHPEQQFILNKMWSFVFSVGKPWETNKQIDTDHRRQHLGSYNRRRSKCWLRHLSTSVWYMRDLLGAGEVAWPFESQVPVLPLKLGSKSKSCFEARHIFLSISGLITSSVIWMWLLIT